MRACGALYVRTRRAATYIRNTLAEERAHLHTAFMEQSPHAYGRAQLRWMFTAMALLQAVGMFHQQAEMRASHLSFQTIFVEVLPSECTGSDLYSCLRR
jgi:hypothetical protein